MHAARHALGSALHQHSLKTAGIAAAALLLAACSSDQFSAASPSDSGTGGSAGSGGASGAGGTSGSGGQGGQAGVGGSAGNDGGGCDTTKSPSEEACLVSDAYAVFVDGTAASSGDGTKASPFKTIAEGVAAAAGKRVLVCDTTYDEHLKLTSPVELYGGFKCADWSVESGQRAVVKPAAKGYALEVDSVTGSVVIEGLELDAADGSAPGDSSVAAFVHGASDVQLDRVKLVAGKGVAGKSGTLAPYTFPTQAQLDGNDAAGLAGGAVKQCNCPAGDNSIGGAGGSAPTQNGGTGAPALGAGQGGTAGTPTDSGNGGTGKNGAPATSPAPAAGATTLGTLSSTGWSPTSAPNGAPGTPGQGGGGGASSATGGGGGGGCGGCGGAGGPGGGGGGASIALLVVDATVTVDAASELVTSAAGDGGKGAAGQVAQAEFGAGGNKSGTACGGGNGGKGASGGGGAGGISVPVVWKGATQPVVHVGATLTPGTQGSKGTGGTPGTNDGVDGVSQPTLELN